MKSEHLGLASVIEVITEALPGLGAEMAAVSLRRTENAEPHDVL